MLVGVPEMVPVDESKERPAGSVGEMLQDVIAPPEAVGVTLVIAESFPNVKELGV